MSNEYVCSLIDKVWLNTDDIQKLCSCSRNSAMTIRKEEENIVKESGKRIPVSKYRVVPTLLVLDYLGIDVDTVLNLNKKKELVASTK